LSFPGNVLQRAKYPSAEGSGVCEASCSDVIRWLQHANNWSFNFF